MRPLFNVSGIGSYPFIMGIISGYPIGAKIVTDLYLNKSCSKEECERLLSFTNNSGPLFIIGTVGISLFGNTQIGILLFITHLLACFTVGFIFRFWKFNKKCISYQVSNFQKKSYIKFSNLGEILSESIKKSIYNIVMIGRIYRFIFSYIINFRTK